MNKIHNCNISKDATLFDRIRLVDCSIGLKCVVGDDTDAVNLTMDDKSELGRRNVIRDAQIGYGSYTGTNTIIKHASIGKFSSISWNVSIGGGNHNYKNISTYSNYWIKRTFDVVVENSIEIKKTIIGNDVWIGNGVIVLPGVNISDGCVVGAGSVVTSDLPPYSVSVGVPAKVIKYRFEKTIIDKLMTLKWWTLPFPIIKEIVPIIAKEPSLLMLDSLIEDLHR